MTILKEKGFKVKRVGGWKTVFLQL
jgi:hypothetical protein